MTLPRVLVLASSAIVSIANVVPSLVAPKTKLLRSNGFTTRALVPRVPRALLLADDFVLVLRILFAFLDRSNNTPGLVSADAAAAAAAVLRDRFRAAFFLTTFGGGGGSLLPSSRKCSSTASTSNPEAENVNGCGLCSSKPVIGAVSCRKVKTAGGAPGLQCCSIGFGW